MGRRRSNKTSNWAGRDIKISPPIAKRSSLPRPNLTVYEDRRLYHPSGFHPVFAEPRSSARIVVPNVNTSAKLKQLRNLNRNTGSTRVGTHPSSLTPRLAFSAPKDVAMCVRRHRRREVLHALGIAGGKGIGRNRKPRRNEWSNISC